MESGRAEFPLLITVILRIRIQNYTPKKDYITYKTLICTIFDKERKSHLPNKLMK